MIYRILCTVSGGVTGFRQSMLTENGKEWSTQVRAEADKKAAALSAEMNNQYSKAVFNYHVVT